MPEAGGDMPAGPYRRGAVLRRAGEVLWHVSGFALGLGAAAVVHALRGRGRLEAATVGERLSRLFERLGPTYVKIGQLLSARADLLPPALVHPLARLQDAVATPEPAAPAERLAATLGPARAARFRRLDPAPIAAGSIAQVYRGELEDGRTVAVKLRRARAVEQVTLDFRLLTALAGVLGRLPGLTNVPLAGLVAEIRASVTAQLDFEREVRGTMAFRARFRHVERIRFPEVVPELSAGDVITMVFVPDMRKITAGALTQGEREAAAVAGLRALYRMIFEAGFVHADMHPGNVLLRPGGELVILDAGLTAELSPTDRRHFTDFFFALVNNRGEVCARVVHDMASWTGRRFDWTAFRAEMVELIARYSALPSRDFEVARFVFELIDLQRRHELRGSTAFIMTVLAMVVYDGICKTLYPACEFQRIARGFIILAKYRRDPVSPPSPVSAAAPASIPCAG